MCGKQYYKLTGERQGNGSSVLPFSHEGSDKRTVPLYNSMIYPFFPNVKENPCKQTFHPSALAPTPLVTLSPLSPHIASKPWYPPFYPGNRA